MSLKFKLMGLMECIIPKYEEHNMNLRNKDIKDIKLALLKMEKGTQWDRIQADVFYRLRTGDSETIDFVNEQLTLQSYERLLSDTRSQTGDRKYIKIENN